MRLERIEERVAVEFVVAFHADIEGAVRQRPGHAENDVAVVELAVVERHLLRLIDVAGSQLRGAGDATAVSTAVREIDAMLLQGFEQRAGGVDLEGRSALIGNGDGPGSHQSQMSLVQSPPG